MKGYIDSLETMGLVDGPGIRFVVFLKGCHLRCLFCHNPETWDYKNSLEMTSEELLKKISNYRHYYQEGGVTFSGGEPLIQKEFLLEMLKKCKMINLHTALDTSGVGNGNYEEILKFCDLIILDIKAYKEDEYLKITGKSMDEFNKFLSVCQKLNKPLWLRQVIIPGFNDTKEYVLGLKEYISKISNIKKVELLAYHDLAKEKYERLGLKYKLKNTLSLSEEKLKELNDLLGI